MIYGLSHLLRKYPHPCILSCPIVEVVLFYLFYFKFKFIYFNWRLITLPYCVDFAIHQYESATVVHVFPIPNPPTHVPPYPIPLGHPSASAPSILHHASNLDRRSVSHMVIYVFQCYSLKSSHLHALECVVSCLSLIPVAQWLNN